MTIVTLERLLKQKQQLEVRIKVLQTKTQRQSRKDDTRRKILAGAYLLNKCDSKNKMEELVQELDQFLFRPNDRNLFGLPPRMDNSINEVSDIS